MRVWPFFLKFCKLRSNCDKTLSFAKKQSSPIMMQVKCAYDVVSRLSAEVVKSSKEYQKNQLSQKHPYLLNLFGSLG